MASNHYKRQVDQLNASTEEAINSILKQIEQEMIYTNDLYKTTRHEMAIARTPSLIADLSSLMSLMITQQQTTNLLIAALLDNQYRKYEIDPIK